MKRNNNMYIVIIAVLLLCVTIGYAALNSTLNITGKSNISKNTWDVYFDNIQVVDGSVEAEKIPTIIEKTTVDFDVVLNLPGEFYEFTVDVVNNGSIDAMIESIEKTPTLTETQLKYINYIIEYENEEQITTKQLVSKNSFVKLKVRVEFKEDVESSDLPTSTVNLGFSLNYVQADESGIAVKDNGAYLYFYVVGNQYKYISGMTWEEWVNSSLNPGEFTNSSSTIYYNRNMLCISNTQVKIYNLIYSDDNYNLNHCNEPT